jgi:hypothetical protein
MKNSVKEKLGIFGYGLITQTAVDALGIAGLTTGMHAHSEQVEHFGDVQVYIYDLHKAWEAHRQTDRQLVTPENAMAWAEVIVPIPQWVAWDLSLNSDVKARFFSNVKAHTRVDQGGGRIGPGAKFHCLHSFGGSLDYTVLDAPNYMTSRNFAFKIDYLLALSFRPVEGGTMFASLYGWPDVKVPKMLSALFRPIADQHVKTFAQIVEEEIAAGRIQPEQFKEIEGRKGEHWRRGHPSRV